MIVPHVKSIHTPYLSPLQPDVLQVIVNFPITSDTIKEPSGTGRLWLKFAIQM